MAKGTFRVNGVLIDDNSEIQAIQGDTLILREDDGVAALSIDTDGVVLIPTVDINGGTIDGATLGTTSTGTTETVTDDSTKIATTAFVKDHVLAPTTAAQALGTGDTPTFAGVLLPNFKERSQKFTASDAEGSDFFGDSSSLSSDGTILAVGATGWDGSGGGAQGVVYIYDWNGSSWTERSQKLTASDAGPGDNFGRSCSLSSDGTILAVGATGDNANQGIVYIYDWNGSSWTERSQKLTASDADLGDRFGNSCSLSSDGTILAVGASRWDASVGSDQGVVYIYDWNGSSWTERTDIIEASDAGGSDVFGYSCSLSSDGTILAVGATGWDGNGGGSQGVVYIYDWNGSSSSWTERTDKIEASDAGPGDYFGSSCSLSSDGTILAVGANGRDGSVGNNQGIVYIYDWNGSSWTERSQKLTASDAEGSDLFGSSCSLSSDGIILAVGANGDNANQGIVYLFSRNINFLL